MESQKQEDIAPVVDDYFLKCIMYLKWKQWFIGLSSTVSKM